MFKKLLFSTVLITGTVPMAHSQITIQMADIAAIGKLIYSANDTLPAPSIVPGPAGSNVTWNFSALNNHFLDTLNFTNPNWTPYGGSFPTSNLAVKQGSNGTIYTSIQGGSFTIVGQVGTFGSTTVVVQMNPNEIFITFPSTFNTSFSNTSGYDVRIPYTQQFGIDSVRAKHQMIKSSLINAWGTVTTPLLSNSACIRQRQYNINTDTLWAHQVFPPQWQMLSATQDTVVHFSWWANNIGFPLVELDSNMDGSITGVSWLQATPVNSGINENYPQYGTIKVYPNPASDMISLDLSASDADRIIVTDIAGRMVLSANVRSRIETISVGELNNGVYLFRVINENGEQAGTGKFTIAK